MGFRTSLATLSLMEIANVRRLEGKMGRELLVLKLLLVVLVVGGWELWVVVEGKMVFWRRVRWLWLRWCLWVRAEEEVDLVSYEASFVGEVVVVVIVAVL
jgi:hypothetical protein